MRVGRYLRYRQTDIDGWLDQQRATDGDGGMT
jgi:hypothetical protein